jgi:hypothetical protein
MAESNQVTLNKATVTGGEVVAADTIALKQYQLIKLILGAAGVNSGPVSAANPLPTGDAAAAAALANILAKLSADPSTAAGVTAAANAIVAQIAANLAGTQPVSAAALPLPAGAATQATLADVLAKLIAAPATESGQTAAQAKLDLIEAVLSAWTFSGGTGLVQEEPLSGPVQKILITNPTSTRGVWHLAGARGIEVVLSELAASNITKFFYTLNAVDDGDADSRLLSVSVRELIYKSEKDKRLLIAAPAGNRIKRFDYKSDQATPTGTLEIYLRAGG